MFGFRLAKRDHALPGGQVLAFAIGLVIALAFGAVLLLVAGHSPVEIYIKMADAAFGSPKAWSVTLTQAVPLGLAVAACSRSARQLHVPTSASTRSSPP